MQIVLLSMDPVFLFPLFPLRTFFFFHSRVGRAGESEGSGESKPFPARSCSQSERSKLLFLKKEKGVRGCGGVVWGVVQNTHPLLCAAKRLKAEGLNGKGQL